MPISTVSFATLKSNYFDGATSPAYVKQVIGGNVNADYITNTCVIKVSKALNGTTTDAIPKKAGLVTVTGADKKNYALRVREFKTYLIHKYGNADVTYKNTKGLSDVPETFKGKTGIIMFDVSGWNDATGHFTLWDGQKCLDGSNYWKQAHEVNLWIVN